MSIPVDRAKLAEALTDFGPGYLLTTSPEGRVKAVTVEPVADGEVLRMPWSSKGTSANLAANPAATLVFPPRQPHGYTLIVDGTARPVTDGFELVAATAVLHRPSAHSDGPPPPEGCGNDCLPLGQPR